MALLQMRKLRRRQGKSFPEVTQRVKGKGWIWALRNKKTVGSDVPPNSLLTLKSAVPQGPSFFQLRRACWSARGHPGSQDVRVWGMPPFSLSSEEVRFEEVQVLKTPAPDCMAPLPASSALPQPYPDLPRADLFQPPFTEQETEAQRAVMLVPGHTASRLLVWSLGDLVFNLSSALPVTLGKSLISRFPRQECKAKDAGS